MGNKTIITILRVGRLYQIVRKSQKETIIVYSREKDIQSKLNLLLEPLKSI